MPLLEVRDLRVEISTEDGIVHAVNGLSFALDEGETLGIVGESGSGKSVGALTLLGLTRFWNGVTITGEVRFQGQDLLKASSDEMRELRGNRISMIFQDPLSSLHPFYRIGDQLVEAVRAHSRISRRTARERAIEMLAGVGIPDPKSSVDAYPHQFSGGMRQRVMIAMAMCHRPRLLIADEPTTALDVTIQAQILRLIDQLKKDAGTTVILITHDLGIIAEATDRVVVMYAGRGVEVAETARLFESPGHPYTWGLLGAIPRPGAPRNEELIPISGLPPSLIVMPAGCPFHPRCQYRQCRCEAVEPALEPDGGDARHLVACVLAPDRRDALWTSSQAASQKTPRTRVAAEEQPGDT